MQGMRMRPIVTDVPRSLVYAHWCRTVQNRLNRSICSLGQGLAGNRALDDGRISYGQEHFWEDMARLTLPAVDLLSVIRKWASAMRPFAVITVLIKKGKVFPYSLPSVGPGADPGVQAVSPQVT